MAMRILLLAVTLLLGVPGTVLAGSPAARLGDQTNHSGSIPTGSPNVFILGLPAALYGTFVPCPLPFHFGGNIIVGSPTVLINGLPAVRSGSVISELGATSIVIGGAATVLIQ
jgi:uncharacterized Zn-binding protein involved in type VI secretion